MHISRHAIVTTTVLGTDYATIALSTEDVINALQLYSDGSAEAGLRAATRAGLFSPVTASATDTVAVDIKPDGAAVVVVVVYGTPTVTQSLSDTANASS